jgi:hypothetical protein
MLKKRTIEQTFLIERFEEIGTWMFTLEEFDMKLIQTAECSDYNSVFFFDELNMILVHVESHSQAIKDEIHKSLNKEMRDESLSFEAL